MEITGEFLTRATIWITIAAYAIGSGIFALSRRRSSWDPAVRLAWTVACISLIAHFISAFHFYHGWSQESAYRETARQTETVFRINWGGGLFVNYFLLIAWIADITWWWLRGVNSYRSRPWSLMAIWHWFLIFVIFNATVVFTSGVVRWVGLAICLTLSLSWAYITKQRLIGATIAIAET